MFFEGKDPWQFQSSIAGRMCTLSGNKYTQEIHVIGAAFRETGETDSSAGVATPLEKAHLLPESPELGPFGFQVLGRFTSARAGLAPCDEAFVARHHRRHFAPVQLGQRAPSLVVRSVAGLPFADWEGNRGEELSVPGEQRAQHQTITDALAARSRAVVAGKQLIGDLITAD